MFTKRIIPCLDVNNGRVVKGVNFVDLKDAGDPVEIAKAYDAAGAQCFQRIVIIPKLGIYITKQNHRIFWYHKTWTPFLFLYFTLTTYSPFSTSSTSVSPVWTSPERIFLAVSVSTYF